MPDSQSALTASILDAWATASRVTSYLVERIPPALWSAPVPGAPRRTIRSIAIHLHNSRCTWTRTLGAQHGIAAPSLVDRHGTGRRQLLAALRRSSRAIAALLSLGCREGGAIPPTRAYVWRNLPLDVGHVLAYFVAHEAHHRGQIVLAARALDLRLPTPATDGLWQWNKRAAEATGIHTRHHRRQPPSF